MYMYLFEFSTLLGTYLGVKFLGHVIILCLNFWVTTKLFCTLATSFYISLVCLFPLYSTMVRSWWLEKENEPKISLFLFSFLKRYGLLFRTSYAIDFSTRFIYLFSSGLLVYWLWFSLFLSFKLCEVALHFFSVSVFIFLEAVRMVLGGLSTLPICVLYKKMNISKKEGNTAA